MKRIVLCTSSSGLDYLETPNNVQVIRHAIAMHGQNYKDGQDLTYVDIANAMMEDKDLLPLSSPPSVKEMVDLFDELYNQGYKEVFIISISSMMSPAYENIYEAKDLCQHNMFIHLFDSKAVSYGEAVLALEADKMISEGASSLDIADRLNKMADNISFFIVIDDLRNMIKTKRISAPAGFFATLFNVKPLLLVDEFGAVVPVAKIRSFEKAIDLLCEESLMLLKEKPGKMYIVDCGDQSLVKKVQSILAQYGVTDVPVYPTGSSAIANHGPHASGIGIIHDC